MLMSRPFRALALLALLLPAAPALAQPAAQNLRIALREDPDILDPTLARTFVGRIVFAALCDKLFDIDERLGLVHQLATAHRWEDARTLTLTLRPGVVFHDGDPLDAEAVRHSLLRHLRLQGSFRRGEIAALTAVDVIDPLTVRLHLSEPSSPFMSQLTDRAGMIMSPRATEAAGREFGRNPVCAGPFRFVERVAQDRIVVERFPQYWDAARIHLNRITYLPIPDSNVRLANLRSGVIEVIQTIDPGDMPALRGDRRFALSVSDELGYQSIHFNVANGPRAATPLGRDARLRRAFDLAIDRAALDQVVYGGADTLTAQAVPPSSPFHIASIRPPGRDLAAARALVREAGVPTPIPVELMVPNNPELRQVGEVVQAMVREAGFDLRIRAVEFATSQQAALRGDFEVYLQGWSGRTDPDGNLWNFLHSTGPVNEGKYADPAVDAALEEARRVSGIEERRALYERVWRIAVERDRQRLYLWHRKNIAVHVARLRGMRAVPDGLIRVQDLRLE